MHIIEFFGRLFLSALFLIEGLGKISTQEGVVMYMEAYAASATATEMKSTVDSMCKLHGLHIPDNATQVNININGTKQLERMSDEDLLKIAGKNEDYLEPSTTG